MSELAEPRIVCAAIHLVDGLIIPSARHFDMTMRLLVVAIGQKIQGARQGFIDQHGNFYDREQAWAIAYHQGQIRRQSGAAAGTLYSEDLY